MDHKERLDQIERLLTDLLHRTDKQDEFNGRVERRFDSLDGRLAGLDGQLAGLDGRLDDVIGILKLSAEAHKQAEERHDHLLREIREQGRRTDLTQAEILRILDAIENQEPRIKRLEDKVFRAAG